MIARTHSHVHISWHSRLAQSLVFSLHAPLPTAASSHQTRSEAKGQKENIGRNYLLKGDPREKLILKKILMSENINFVKIS